MPCKLAVYILEGLHKATDGMPCMQAVAAKQVLTVEHPSLKKKGDEHL